MRWLIAIGELALLVWFVAVALDAVFQRAFVDRDSPFRLGEFHHAYLGAGVVILGFLLHSVTGCFVQLLGVVFTVDDTWQHMVQTLDGKHGYRSPLHQIFARYLWPLPIVQWLVRALDRWWFVGVVFGLLAVWIFGCAAPTLVRSVLRPDTHEIMGVLIDSAIGRRTAEIFDRWLPNENAVCFYGDVGDTLVDGTNYRFLRIRNVRPSQIDSTSEEHVFFPVDPVTGCSGEGLVGWGHSHPGIASSALLCTHSPPDAEVTAHDPRLLIGVVFCANGRGEILFQDTRRYQIRWAVSQETPP